MSDDAFSDSAAALPDGAAVLPDWAAGLVGGADGVARIEAAIERAEARTSGEIVPVVVRRSSTIGHVPFLAFALVVALFALVELWLHASALGGPPLVWAGGAAVLAAALATGLARLDGVQRWLTPRLDQMHQVDLRAQIEFYELALAHTRDRTGVLLLVSLMEHRAVVLADRGIAQRLPAEVWEEVVALMVNGVKAGDLAGGMERAIERCGELLAAELPLPPGDVNELRDHLVVKD